MLSMNSEYGYLVVCHFSLKLTIYKSIYYLDAFQKTLLISHLFPAQCNIKMTINKTFHL